MPVYAEFPLRIAKMWKDEEDKAKKETNGDADVEMDDAEDKKHRDMFNKPEKMHNVFYNYSDDDSDEDSDSEDDEAKIGREMERNILIN